jgi:hypothetical protein
MKTEAEESRPNVSCKGKTKSFRLFVIPRRPSNRTRETRPISDAGDLFTLGVFVRTLCHSEPFLPDRTRHGTSFCGHRIHKYLDAIVQCPGQLSASLDRFRSGSSAQECSVPPRRHGCQRSSPKGPRVLM